MSYTERLIITVPDTISYIAAKIAKALDPDTGGEYSFTDNGDGTITVDTPCEPQFKYQIESLITDVNALHEILLLDYSLRWPELAPPTLEECKQFIDAIIKPVL